MSLVFGLTVLSLTVLCPTGAAQVNHTDFLEIASESAILADGESGRILYQKNPDTPLPPASMTKMMTEYLVLDAIKNGRISWNQKIPISDYAYRVSQNRKLSNVPLRKDERYTVRELYESMTIYSANGSTIALAELVAGSEANFIKMMSQKAAQLGMKNYKFVNSTGLNNRDLTGMHPPGTGSREENAMSARATAILAYRLIHDHPEVLKASSVTTKIFREGTKDRIKMDNWNWMLPGLVYGYPGCDGLKTGTTDLGGYSFAATAKRKGIRFISVVMKADSYASRFGETKKLLDYAFDNYSPKVIFPAGFKAALPVANGKKKTAEVASAKALVVVVKPGEEKFFRPAYLLNPSVSKNGVLLAPLREGQTVGYLTTDYTGPNNYGYLTAGGREKVGIATTTAVKKVSWLTVLFRKIAGLLTHLLSLAR